ncbi:MAG: TauD/TfdA family dioxygenase [Rhodoferax sp.]|nr:TauD/TfdA family dioxygenase [Rhodoferax sp.]
MGQRTVTQTPKTSMQQTADKIFNLPEHQETPAAWYGPDMAGRSDWIEHFAAAELDELAAAGAVLADPGVDLAALRAADHPLPQLAPRLKRIARDVQDGRGFVLLRGLPVERWGRLQAARAFMLLGAHLGNARPQNALGHVLGHVRDMGLHSVDPAVRIYQTSERQTFHTDSCDIVGLLCLQTARSGGQSALVSSITIFNELLKRRPDLAAQLFQPIATDRRGEVPPGEKPYFSIPVFNWWPDGANGQLSAIYQRQYIDSAMRFPDAPRLTVALTQALDLLDALTNDPALHFLMDLQPGDIQLVHNHTLLHDRTAFEDWPEPQRRRHLLRLWLSPPEARPLPNVYAQRYGSIEPGARGGVCLPTAPWNVPLDAL